LSVLQIRSHIEKETEAEIQNILAKAEAEAKAIVEDAKKEAARLIEEQKQKQASESLAKERSELAILRMNQRAELTRMKAEWLDRAFEEAKQRLDKLAENSGSSTYRDFLAGLVFESTVKMRGSKFTIQADNRESEILKGNLNAISKRIVQAKGVEVELQIETKPDIPPGVIIRSPDERQYYNNTLEARLTSVRQRLSGQIYSLLFKEGA
jgi:vacuolar-type H+-ATPase subunit E/Vma4